MKVDAVKGDTARFFKEICHLKTFAYRLELAEVSCFGNSGNTSAFSYSAILAIL
jgi:hypothetical protein